MAQVINTNIASLNAQRNLNKSQGALNTSLQRLSSGMRINSAKDDAAGLAISERFTAQIRGLNQAVRNSNDGISLAQTAEGALGEVTNNLQRVRELAVQSANATNSASDRAAMQQEVSQLVSEIDRVAKQTNFNGVSLLDGSFSSQAFQVGANVGQTITVASIANATKSGLGIDNAGATVTSTAVTSAALLSGDITVNGASVGASATSSAKDKAAAINTAGATVGVTATASTAVNMGAFTTSAVTNGTTFTLTVKGVAMVYTAAGGTGITAAGVQGAVTGAASSLATAGITVGGTVAGGDLTFTDADGDDVAFTGVSSAGAADFATADGTARGLVTVKSAGADLVVAGSGVAKAGLSAATTAMTANTLDVSTVAGANLMIAAIDTALGTVNGSRATLGAIQNRFESVVTSLQTSSESLSAARSRIQDADFASETANLTKTQILQQAGTAMLAQANQLPQGVLSLLR
jgi:flagellin